MSELTGTGKYNSKLIKGDTLQNLHFVASDVNLIGRSIYFFKYFFLAFEKLMSFLLDRIIDGVITEGMI